MSSSAHSKSDTRKITVRGNNIDQALRVLKRQMQKDGTFREMKTKQFFTPPTQQRREEEKKSLVRIFKTHVKGLQQQGLTKEEARIEARKLMPK